MSMAPCISWEQQQRSGNAQTGRKTQAFGYSALPARSILSAQPSTGGDFGDPQLYQEGNKNTFKAVNLQDIASETTTLVESVPFAGSTDSDSSSTASGQASF